MSSALKPASIAVTASPINSPACAPIMWTAMILSLLGWDRTFIFPAVSPVVFPLALAVKGKIPFGKKIVFFSLFQAQKLILVRISL